MIAPTGSDPRRAIVESDLGYRVAELDRGGLQRIGEVFAITTCLTGDDIPGRSASFGGFTVWPADRP